MFNQAAFPAISRSIPWLLRGLDSQAHYGARPGGTVLHLVPWVPRGTRRLLATRVDVEDF